LQNGQTHAINIVTRLEKLTPLLLRHG